MKMSNELKARLETLKWVQKFLSPTWRTKESLQQNVDVRIEELERVLE